MATATRTNVCTLTTNAALPTAAVSSTDRSRKRVLTEARREQNRANQRAFRQKQREQRRQGLQHRYKHSSAKKPNLQPRPTYHGSSDTSVTLELARAFGNTPPTFAVEPELILEERMALDNAAIQPLSSLDSSCTFPTGLHPMSDLESGQSAIELLSAPASTLGPLFSSVDSNSTSIPSGFEVSCFGPYEDLNVDVSGRDEESSGASDLLDPRYLSDAGREWTSPQGHILPEVPPIDLLNDPNGQSQALTNRTFDIESVIAAGLEVLLCGRRPESTSQEMMPSHRLPNPRINCITFHPNKIILGCIQNAQSMGFLAQDVIMPRCLAPSPFYRRITPADDPKKLLAALTRPSTPVNLRPTLPQLLYPHSAFMDLIPMPVFRARAITLAATRPHLFDMTELKKDMVAEDGFVLWSSTSSSVSSHQRDGQGQPWDIRSWEAAPWFLRKWRMLVDGEEGEVWNQSLWWQRARGEAGDGTSNGDDCGTH